MLNVSSLTARQINFRAAILLVMALRLILSSIMLCVGVPFTRYQG
jgi:hypothetical protein